MASDLKIKATNYVANLTATPKNTKFHPIINFLNNCPLTHALTAAPMMDQELLVEFWSTASTTRGFAYLSGQVKGKELRFTSTTLATALQLPTDNDTGDPPSKEQIWEMLEAIGYEEKNPKLGSILRNKMSPSWSFFFFVLIKCISGKTGTWDQAAGLTLHLAYGLIMGKKIDYAKMIFEDICRKVGNDTLLYPRFLSLMMQTQSRGEIITPVLELPICLISAKFYRNKREEKGEKPLTTAMLSLLLPSSKKSRTESQRVAAELSEEIADDEAHLSEREAIDAYEFLSGLVPDSSDSQKAVIEENLVQQPDHTEEFSICDRVEKLTQELRSLTSVESQMTEEIGDDETHLSEREAIGSYKAPYGLVPDSFESEKESVAEEVDTNLLAEQSPTAKEKDVAEVVSVDKLTQELGSSTSVESQMTEEIGDDEAHLSEREAIGAYKASSGLVADSSDSEKSVFEERFTDTEENLEQLSDHTEEFSICDEDEHLDSDAESQNTAFNDPTLEERLRALEDEFFRIKEERSSVSFFMISMTITVYVVLMEVLALVMDHYMPV